MDPSAKGPFALKFIDTASDLTTHSLFVPNDTGSQGKYPVVVWQCGNGASVSFYMSFLEHLASHGFFVAANKVSSSDRTAEAASESRAVDWIVAENERAGGEYAGKLDVQHIAVMGHSLGSLTSFEVAASNAHVATSIHFSGGLTGNPVGFDMKWLASLTKPAAFLCGADDTAAGPACEQDFAQAPSALPLFYGVLANADHIGPFLAAPNGGDYGTAAVAWLRWQLASDSAFKPWFSGASCKLCSPPWTARQRNLD
jgi:predicted dienelactone hydrolase